LIGRFLDAHSFDDARNENGTECIGKRIDGAFEDRTNFTLGHVLLWIAGRQGRKVDDFRRLPIGPVSFPIHSRTPEPQSSGRLVHCDARDPRAEGRIAAKHVEAGEGEHVVSCTTSLASASLRRMLLAMRNRRRLYLLVMARTRLRRARA
jgi:hypothetical protein